MKRFLQISLYFKERPKMNYKIVFTAILLAFTLIFSNSPVKADDYNIHAVIKDMRTIAQKLENAASDCRSRISRGARSCSVRRNNVRLSISEAEDIANKLRANANEIENHLNHNYTVNTDRGTYKSPGLDPIGTEPKYDKDCLIRNRCKQNLEFALGACMANLNPRNHLFCNLDAFGKKLSCLKSCRTN